MSLKEELKEEAGNEKRKLKEMSRQDKLWYIWEYYKFHIAAVIGVIFLIYIIGTSIYNSTKETMVYCAVVNNYSEIRTHLPLISMMPWDMAKNRK